SSPAALIASCGQYVGCAYPTARSFPFTLSGILSTQEGTTMPSLYGFPHRFNFGAGCAFGPPAQACKKQKHTAKARRERRFAKVVFVRAILRAPSHASRLRGVPLQLPIPSRLRKCCGPTR